MEMSLLAAAETTVDNGTIQGTLINYKGVHYTTGWIWSAQGEDCLYGIHQSQQEWFIYSLSNTAIACLLVATHLSSKRSKSLIKGWLVDVIHYLIIKGKDF